MTCWGQAHTNSCRTNTLVALTLHLRGQLRIDAQMLCGHVRAQLAVLASDGTTVACWEQGPNRKLDTTSGAVTISDKVCRDRIEG